MATTMNKNKVSDMAKDFGLTSKDILSVLSTYEDGSKKPSQVLSADEVNLIFEHLTQKHGGSLSFGRIGLACPAIGT